MIAQANRVEGGTDPPRLSTEHSKMLLEESDIAPEIAAERGYQTVTRSEVPEVFKSYQRRNGLLIPTLSPSGRRGVRLRPDKPRTTKDGKLQKYEQPAGVGNALDVHPRSLATMKDPSIPLWITEGEKKADCLTSRGLCAVALTGVWCWVNKGGRAVECWEHIALEGREVYVVFDSDVMDKGEVQLALQRLVAFLEERGARVQVVYLPGPEKGIDDYLIAGGTVQELKMLARPFEQQDFARVRLSRDEQLRAGVADLWRRWGEMPVKTRGENTRRSVKRVLIAEAEKSGKPVEDGLRVKLASRTGALHAGISQQTWVRAVAAFENEGQIRIEKGRKKDDPASYVLLTGRALVSHYGGSRTGRGEKENTQGGGEPDRYGGSYPGDSLARGDVPELRWSTTLIRRETDKRGRAVEVREHLARLGKKRAAMIEHLLDASGSATVAELMERFAGAKSRPRDFKKRQLAPLEDPAVIVVEGDTVTLTESWREALEHAREIGGEEEAARLQAERYQRQRTAFRNRDKLAEPEPVPHAPALDDMRQSWAYHPDGCACRECSGRFGRVVGEHVADCRCGECFRERREQSKSATRARLVVLDGDAPNAGPVEDWRTHALSCECEDCIYPEPQYARAWGNEAKTRPKKVGG